MTRFSSRRGAPFLQNGFELFLRLLLLVAHGGGALEILVLDRPLLLGLDLLDLGLEALDLGRAGHGADARARAGLVHHVDGLVGQEAVGDVAVGKLDRGLDGLVGELGLVMVLVFRAEALEDQDRLLDGRRLDLDRLEAAFQRGVLLDVLAVFVERGGADALQFAAAQGGLDDVRGVHRAFGGAGADDGVQLVDEEDDVLGAADLVHHGLDALLELAAILGAGDHQGQVERDDPLVAEQLRHVAGGDFLGQAFDDGRLAHAGLAEQHRIVLGAAAEDLDDALDFVLAADDRVHLALAGDLGQVAAEGLQRGRLDLALLLGSGLFRSLAGGVDSSCGGEIGVELLQDLLAGLLDVHVEVLEHARGDAVAFAQQAEQDVLGADVGVIERLGFLAASARTFFTRGV